MVLVFALMDCVSSSDLDSEEVLFAVKEALVVSGTVLEVVLVS